MKNKRYRFYIAHTFEERHFVRDEFVPALQAMGIETVNPFYNTDGSHKEQRPEVKLADEMGTTGRFWKAVRKKHISIVEVDLGLIDGCDGVIAFMAEGSTGTTCELFYTGGVFQWLASQKKIPKKYLKPFLGKRVFLVTTNSRLLKHPWLSYTCEKMFKTPKSLRRYLKKHVVTK